MYIFQLNMAMRIYRNWGYRMQIFYVLADTIYDVHMQEFFYFSVINTIQRLKILPEELIFWKRLLSNSGSYLIINLQCLCALLSTQLRDKLFRSRFRPNAIERYLAFSPTLKKQHNLINKERFPIVSCLEHYEILILG